MSPMLHTLPAPSLGLTIIAFIALLGPLVTIHELGHYLVGRWCGAKADAFSIGFGRELVGWTDRRGTRWKISLLPLGGYVLFAGDANAASLPKDAAAAPVEERAQWLQFKPLWARVATVSAGPLANALLAVLILAGFNMAGGHLVIPPVIGGFQAPSAGAAAGLRVGDRITAVDGKAIDDFADLRDHLLLMPGATMQFTVLRGGKAITLPVTLGVHELHDDFGHSERVGWLGVRAADARLVPVGPLAALRYGAGDCATIIGTEVAAVGQMITGNRGFSDVGGPVKMAQAAGEQMSLGALAFIAFLGFVSINLAFINLLPIPGLDGGHLLFYLGEALRGKPLSPRSQGWAMGAGLAFVVALMVVITAHDIAALPFFAGHGFGG